MSLSHSYLLFAKQKKEVRVLPSPHKINFGIKNRLKSSYLHNKIKKYLHINTIQWWFILR